MRWSTRLRLAQDPAISAEVAQDLVRLCLPGRAVADVLDYRPRSERERNGVRVLAALGANPGASWAALERCSWVAPEAVMANPLWAFALNRYILTGGDVPVLLLARLTVAYWWHYEEQGRPRPADYPVNVFRPAYQVVARQTARAGASLWTVGHRILILTARGRLVEEWATNRTVHHYWHDVTNETVQVERHSLVRRVIWPGESDESGLAEALIF